MNSDRFEAYVNPHSIISGHAELWLTETYLDGQFVVPVIDGEVHRRNTDELTPTGAHVPPLLLGVEYLRPLRDAIDRALGAQPDDWKAKYEEARDALFVERKRVDMIVARGLMP